MGKILLKIQNFLKKLKKPKKKKYSLIPLLRIYEELAKQELEANKKQNIEYIYIHEHCEYIHYSNQPTAKDKTLQFSSEIEFK